MDYLKPTILAMVFFAIYPLLGSRAGEVHGEKVNFIIDTCWMVIISLILAVFFKDDFAKVTRQSLLYAQGLALSSVAFLLMLYAWRIAPGKIGIIMITIGFSTVLNAVIIHFLDQRARLSGIEWCGVFVSFTGIIMVNWKKIIQALQS